MIDAKMLEKFEHSLGELEGEIGVRAAAQSRRETLLHDAADRHLNDLAVAIRYGFAAAKKSIADRLATAKTKDAVDVVMNGVPQTLEQELLAVLPGTLTRIVRAGGVVSMSMLRERMSNVRAAADFEIKFDVENESAANWARKHAAKLASNLSKTSRDAIREAIAGVLEGDSFDDAYEDILDAVGDEARAELIARTEIMTAVHEGQREAWAQAVDEGLLTGREQRVWIATEGACDACEELDGQTAPMDGTYPDDIDGPPLHPRCRCTEGIQ